MVSRALLPLLSASPLPEIQMQIDTRDHWPVASTFSLEKRLLGHWAMRKPRANPATRPLGCSNKGDADLEVKWDTLCSNISEAGSADEMAKHTEQWYRLAEAELAGMFYNTDG